MSGRDAALALVLAALAAPAVAFERPKDFDAFWARTRRELDAIPPRARFETDPAHSDRDVACFKVSYASLKRTIHARYCRPARDGRFPAVLISPWYAMEAVPVPDSLAKRGIAALWFQARGYEVDASTYPLANSWYVLDGIDAPETYVFRELVAHAWRGLDVLAARPEVNATRLGVMGASQGGGLSLIVAGIDPRVKAVAADFPFLSDWEDSLKAPSSPYADVRRYMDEHPERRAAVLRAVAYYDSADVADRIEVPILLQAGLKDRTCPAKGIERVFARIAAQDKALLERPDADHTDEGAERWKDSEDFLVDRLQRPLK